MKNEQANDRMWFSPFCSENEIDRILNVSNSQDYLLSRRANTIADHVRYLRVVLAHRNSYEKNDWDLSKFFKNDYLFEYYTLSLRPEDQEKCKRAASGFLFSNDCNGYCIKTEYDSNIVTVSYSLKYFLDYMNVAFGYFKVDVPVHVRVNSMMIAIRTMLKTEALDFELDPRGILPEDVEWHMSINTQNILNFVIGHEYAHHLLGHLNNGNTKEIPMLWALSADTDYGFERVYNSSEKEEFEADEEAITRPEYDHPIHFKDMVSGALMFFGYIDVFQTVSDQLFPRAPWKVRTHPSPSERFQNILGLFKDQADIDSEWVDSFLGGVDFWKNALQKDIPVNIEAYEKYGSVYLDKSNTLWRGPKRVDRVDY